MITIFKKYFNIIKYVLKNKLNRKIIENISRKKIVRNVFTVASGTVIAQSIMMIFSPIITRFYGPEALGNLGVFNSIVSIVTPIAALTYPIAIVLPKDDYDAKSLVKLSIYISIVMSFIIALFFIIFGNKIITLLQIEEISPYLILIPLVMLFSCGHQVAQQWLIRTKQFSVRAKAAIGQALAINFAKTGLGLYHPIASSLILISSLGHALHAIMLFFGVRKYSRNNSREKNKKINIIQLKSIAKKYNDFPKYRAPEVFINGISQSLPVLILTVFFGPTVAGFYALGKKVLNLPTELIGNAIGDVFYPHIATTANNHERTANTLIKATLVLALIGIIPYSIIFIFGPTLFKIVFGIEWVTAGNYARWMALWSYFAFINKPSVKTLPVLSEQRFHLNISVTSIVARLIGLMLGAYFLQNDLIAVIFYSLAGTAVNIFLITVTINKSLKYDRKNIR